MSGWTKRDLSTLERAAAPHGGTVDYQGDGIEFVNVDTPPGKVWRCNGCHTIVADAGNNDDLEYRAQRELAKTSALVDIAMGVDACETPDCDNCEGGPT